MITIDEIIKYHGPYLERGEDYIYIPPHKALRNRISCYTITFPQTMPDEYTIIPSASSTMVLSVDNQQIIGSLSGASMTPYTVGNYANKKNLIVLVEFRTGCLHPFVHIDQSELADRSFNLHDIDKGIYSVLSEMLLKADTIEELVHNFDRLFLTLSQQYVSNPMITEMVSRIIAQNGTIRMKDLSNEFYYSEKQIRRLFHTYVGIAPKTFSRIVRVNHTIYTLKNQQSYLTDTALQSGYFDQPHFINDFKSICGVTPTEYLDKMSVFYNEEYKYEL